MGSSPGAFGAQVPDRLGGLARRQRDAQRAATEQAAARLLDASTIGSGGTLTCNGSLIINGSLTVPAGSLNTAFSISAGTTITAGGNISSTSGSITAATSLNAQSLAIIANATIGGTLGVTGALSAASLATTGNVSASGQVISSGPLKSPGSYAYTVHIGSWVAGWIDSDGTLGTSPSSSLVKTGLTKMTADDARKLLSLTPYWGRYVWDPDDIPPRVFFLAEDVQAAGFGPDVVPTVTDQPLSMLMPDGSPILDANGAPVVIPVGHAFTVNYSQMVVPLVAAWHDGAQQMQLMRDQMTALQAQVTALQAKVNPPTA